MKIKLDSDGYVSEWALHSDDEKIICLPDGIEVDDIPDDEVEQFYEESRAYYLSDGKLVKDLDRMDEIVAEREKQALRNRRAIECFSIVNRGEAWYDTLTAGQREELRSWYLDWLDVTETLSAPTAPDWIKYEVI